MKKLYKLIILSLFVFASCGLSHAEDATEKSIATINMMSDAYDKIADGSLEGDAAVAELKKLGAMMKELAKSEEGKEMSEEDTKKAIEKLQPATERMAASAAKAAQSGKLTAEMIQAMAAAAQ